MSGKYMVELTFEAGNEEDDRRRFERFDTQRKARYFLKEGSRRWKECTIINISRKGVGILFPAHEKITMGSTILLKMFYSAETESTSVIGMLRWMRKRKNMKTFTTVLLKSDGVLRLRNADLGLRRTRTGVVE
jgi:hypothetical protein